MRRTLVATAALMALGAHAQTSPAPEGGLVLNPVVVTATPGLPQAAFDTPASVDVVGGSQIRDGQLGVNVSESLARVPGITALNRQNYAQDIQVSSRGYGARSTFGVRGLRLYTDGIPATAPDGQGQVSHFDLLTADRIEVLRGPFSALYGNSSGGVISLFTADGGPQTVGEVGASFGSDGLRRETVRASGQNGALQYNLGASLFETDGTRPHSAASRDAANGKLKYNIDGDTKLSLVFNEVHMPDVQDALGLTRAEYNANPQGTTANAFTYNTRKTVSQTQAGLVFEKRLAGGDSFKLSGWDGARGTEQWQAIPPSTQVAASSPGGVIALDRSYQGADAQYTLRTRLADAPLAVTAGMTTERLRENRFGYQNFIGPAAAPTQLGVQGALRRDEVNSVRSFDQYVQGVWSLSRWSLTAGLRHSQVDFSSEDHYLVNGNDSGSKSYSATNPVLGLVFHATDNLNLYASAGRGFETPTFNELAYRPGGPGLNFNLQAATSRQYELGAKALLGAGWQGNVAVYQARTANELAVLSNSGGRSTYQNVAQTLRQGVEASLAGRWDGGWSAQLAATVLRARYDSDFLTCVTAPCTKPTVPVASGSLIPGIPRSSAFGELAWSHQPWGLVLASEMRYTGRIMADDRNTDFAPASTVFALRASLQQKAGAWTFKEFARVDNVADRRYIGSVIVNESNGRFFEPGPGRTWLIGLNAALAL